PTATTNFAAGWRSKALLHPAASCVCYAAMPASTMARARSPWQGRNSPNTRTGVMPSASWTDLPAEVLAILRGGAVLPAHPLALAERRRFEQQPQRALSRYYIDAGAGGLAVGVHATQFRIREAGLYRPVLELAAQTASSWARRPLVMIAGATGRTRQAVDEAQTARALGFHAVLLGLSAMK